MLLQVALRVQRLAARLLTVYVVSICCSSAYAIDRVMTTVIDESDIRHLYYRDLLSLALQSSKDKFGAYEVIYSQKHMPSRRKLAELVSGKNLSIDVSMPKVDWEGKTLVVPFPIYKGLASFRLFLVLEENQALVSRIRSLHGLKFFNIGQGRGWSTNKILEDHGFTVVYGDDYSGLFPMLGAGRFQLLMRGADEILSEIRAFTHLVPSMQVAKNIAVYTYLPQYINVTKKQPKLAKRLEYGLKKAFEEGKLDAIFNQYYARSLEFLGAKNRRIFHLKNTNIDPSLIQRDERYLIPSVGVYRGLSRGQGGGQKSLQNEPVSE
ncbi:MAG: hypothetical protein COA42_22000 [Alteromonadaceae bacterium]|nr:MAG: hypothetical protein COA42_22000 [Alteromonadaceae bacterium]